MAVCVYQANLTSARKLLTCLCLLLLLPFTHTASAAAETATSLRTVIQRTILDSPEVQEKWYALQASSDEQKRSKGAYLPRIDLTSRIGMEWRDTPTANSELQPVEASVELAQMLYDGFATRNEVRKFGHARLARFYELLDTSENVALEATRAYLEVLKFRSLLQLAEMNYQEHHTIYQQVRERVEAGVGRGVDLEQATGRLALADSNRITELTNLHDVSSRYLRIVGSLPPAQLEETAQMFSDHLPEEIDMALAQAFQSHPAFHAAMENVQAARADRDVRKAANQPRLEFRARHEVGEDRSSIDGRSDESVVELVLNYNLFRGGADAAAIRQFTSQMKQARRQQARVCRSVRQTLDIAFNDVQQLQQQLVQLDRHQTAIANARIAYRNQFDIGQRTLLDLLDTENEYFQSRRAYVNASYDQQLAQARTLAGLGQLLTKLDIRQEGLPHPADFSPEKTDIDPDSICPPLAASQPVLSSELLSTQKAPERVKTPERVPPVVKTRTLTALAPAPVPATPLMVLKKSLNIQFPYRESKIPEEFNHQLKLMVDFLKQYPQTIITVNGHTDNVGGNQYNQKLSRTRAEVVRNRLIDSFGINPERIFIAWFGYNQPKKNNETSAGRSANRRVEVLAAMITTEVSSPKTQESALPTASKMVQEKRLAIIFPYRGSKISEEYNHQLKDIADLLKQYTQTIVTLSGYTDKVGGNKYNQKLARARAEIVRDRLINNYGVLPSRVFITWSSFDQSKGSKTIKGGDAESRRTDVQISRLVNDLSALKK